jgi:hypothetical protein
MNNQLKNTLRMGMYKIYLKYKWDTTNMGEINVTRKFDKLIGKPN